MDIIVPLFKDDGDAGCVSDGKKDSLRRNQLFHGTEAAIGTSESGNFPFCNLAFPKGGDPPAGNALPPQKFPGNLPKENAIVAAPRQTFRTAFLFCLAVSGAVLNIRPASAGRIAALKQSYAAPTLSRIAPGQIDAGSPAFTLTVYGSGFHTNSVVRWTAGSRTTVLSTAFISPDELRAAVPAGLVANPGSAGITVHTPNQGTSASRTFTILVTSLQWNVAMSYNSGGEYTALLHIKNTGYRTAEKITLTHSTLGVAATTSALPMSLGTLTPGSTLVTDLTYPASAGRAGEIVSLNIAGTFTGDSFDQIQRVTLP